MKEEAHNKEGIQNAAWIFIFPYLIFSHKPLVEKRVSWELPGLFFTK